MPDPRLLLLDVGGTDVKAALDTGGRLQRVRRVPVRTGDAAGHDLVAHLARLSAELLDGTEPDAVGLLSPGIVDVGARRTVFAANLGLRDAAVADLLADRLGVPVGFGHDVAQAAQAEYDEGAGGAGAESVMIVVIGTGIAATSFVNGARIEAPGAGELGHVPVPGGRECACGAHGCLETVASAAAIARAYTEATGRQITGAVDVFAAMKAGDPAAQEVLDAAVEALAFALNWAVGLLGVTRVVIGGGLSGAGEALVAPLRSALARRLSYQPLPDLVLARLGGDAGLRGARLVALSALGQARA
jgi:glucokinase